MIRIGEIISVDNFAYFWQGKGTTNKTDGATRWSYYISSSLYYYETVCRVEFWERPDDKYRITITPNVIAACIRYAIHNGWQPQQEGQKYTIELDSALLSALTPLMANNSTARGNILNLSNPDDHHCKIIKYQTSALDTLSLLTIQLHDTSIGWVYQYVQFKGVEYFAGSYEWWGANIFDMTSQPQILKGNIPKLAQKTDQELEFYRNLFVVNPNTVNEIKILAAMVEIINPA